MTAIPIMAVSATASAAPELQAAAAQLAAARPTARPSFAGLLLDGVERVDRKIAEADALARAFAVDDSIPVHQVTFALEQARLSLELLEQVRARLVGGYQELMRMQL